MVNARERDRLDSMILAMSREVRDGDICLVGAASLIPTVAFCVAQHTAGSGIWILSPTGALSENVPVPLTLDSWDVRVTANAGAWIPLGVAVYDWSRLHVERSLEFVRPAQLDVVGRVNTSRLQLADGRQINLPGSAGLATVFATRSRVHVYLTRHDARSLRPTVDVVSGAASHGVRLHTPLGIFEIDPGSGASTLALQAGVDRDEVDANTPFPIAGLGRAARVPAPSQAELDLLERVDPIGIRFLEAMPADARLDSIEEMFD